MLSEISPKDLSNIAYYCFYEESKKIQQISKCNKIEVDS